jgi:hypothetical protein
MRPGTEPTGLCSFPHRGVNPSSPVASAFPTADPESNRSAWSRPEDPLSQDATTVRHGEVYPDLSDGRLVVSVQSLPVSAARQLTC